MARAGDEEFLVILGGDVGTSFAYRRAAAILWGQTQQLALRPVVPGV